MPSSCSKLNRSANLAGAILLASALTLAGGLLPSQRAAAQDPDNGRHNYAYYGCLDCHGVDGQGDVGPKIAGISVSMEEFLTQLRTPLEEMDPYPADFLPDELAADIYAFLQTLE